jgi:hypothetical protein
MTNSATVGPNKIGWLALHGLRSFVLNLAIIAVAAYLLGEFWAGSGLIFAIYSLLAYVALEAIAALFGYWRKP